MVVAVIPGAEAVSAPCVAPDLEPEPDELQAASTIAADARVAIAAMAWCVLFIWCLLPGVRWPARAGAGDRKARPHAARPGRTSGARHPGSPSGRAASPR